MGQQAESLFSCYHRNINNKTKTTKEKRQMKDLLNKMNEDFCKIFIKANSHDAFLEEQSGELNPDLPTCKECGNEDYWEDISYYNYLGSHQTAKNHNNTLKTLSISTRERVTQGR